MNPSPRDADLRAVRVELRAVTDLLAAAGRLLHAAEVALMHAAARGDVYGDELAALGEASRAHGLAIKTLQESEKRIHQFMHDRSE